MPEEDHKNLKKIQCWIPVSTWEKVKERGYPNFSKAVNEALDLLLEVPREIPLDATPGNSEFPDSLENSPPLLRNFPASPENFPASPENFPASPENFPASPENFPEFSEFKALIEEKGRHIESLKTELEKANKREEDLKVFHRRELEKAEKEMEELRVANFNYVELKASNEGLKCVLEEKEKRIEELTKHYANISDFANFFKSKKPELIEAPAAEKSKPWWRFW